MAYNPTVYVNDNPPAINAANLNKSENGIYSVAEIADEMLSVTGHFGDDSYSYKKQTASATSNNYRLNENDGLCSSNSTYKIVKYAVTPGTLLRIVSDDRFQFQSIASVPSSGTSNRIGLTYGAGTYYLVVPTGATYLIVSTLKTGSAAAVYTCISIKESVANTNDAINGTIDAFDIGKRLFNAPFIHGWFSSTTGEILTEYENRIICEDYFQFSEDLPVVIESGFSYILQICNAQHEQTSQVNLSANYTIPSGTIFRVGIRRTSNISEVADIEEFRSKLYYVSATEKRLDGIETDIDEINTHLDLLDETAEDFGEEFSKNIFNKNAEYVDGYYVSTSGSVGPLSGWGYIIVPIVEGKKISVYTNGARMMSCYFSSSTVQTNKMVSGGEDITGWTKVVTVPAGAKIMTVSCKVTDFENINICYSEEVVADIYPYNQVFPLPNLSKYWSTEGAMIVTSSDNLLEKVMEAYERGITEIIVGAGTYDIIAEYQAHYGNDCFDNYVTGYNSGVMGKYGRGLWLENIKIKFNPGAFVVCHYTGSNSYVKTEFSALATGNNVEIDGLNLDSSEVRYGIHADFNTGRDETYFIVRNCDLYNFRTNTVCQAIGAGLGVHVNWLIEDCIFRSYSDKTCLRIHNNVSSDAKSKVVVKNCYIVGNGNFVFNSYSTSTAITYVQCSNCSWITPPVNGKETEQSQDNIVMLAYNNETRAS